MRLLSLRAILNIEFIKTAQVPLYELQMSR